MSEGVATGRVLVTGGSGLIGRRLTAELAADGHEVVVLSRRPDRVRGLPAGVQAAGWDGRTTQGWGPLVDGARAVINLAGENIAAGRWTARRKARIRDSRTDAARAVSEAVRRAAVKPAVLLQASAVGIYGPRGDEELDESSSFGADFLAQVCRAWEEGTAGLEELGVRRVLLRTGVVLSAGGGALPKMAAPVRAFAGGPLGTGRQWVPWIHEADQTAAMRFLLETDEVAGPVNLVAPEPVRNGELMRTLGRVLGRPSALPAPAFALRLALGEMAQMLLTGQRALPTRLQQLGFSFRFPSLEAALRDLLA